MALAAVRPGRHGGRRRSPQEPPASPGAARQRWQRACTGFPGCFPFWGRLRRVVAGCCLEPAPASVCWKNCKWWCSATPRGAASRARPRRTVRPGAETSPDLPAAQEEVGAAADTEHRGTGHQDPAKKTAGGDGRQPRRGHRQRARAAAHRQRAENKDGQAPGPATSPTTSAISFLPTVQQRDRVRHLQASRHRTISWNGVSRDRSGYWTIGLLSPEMDLGQT